MKARMIFCFLLPLVMLGCEYKFPAVEQAKIPTDPALVGLWAEVDEGGEPSEDQMLILAFNKNEYMVKYPTGPEGFWFRAYRIQLDGLAAIQLQWLGDEKKPLDEKHSPYQVCLYQIDGDRLSVRLLNSEVIPKDISGSEALKQRILENKDHPELFDEPGRFKKKGPA